MQKNIYISFEKYIFMQKMFVTNKIQIFLKYIFILQKKNFFDHKKKSLKLRCELNNLVLKFSEASNMWYSLN